MLLSSKIWINHLIISLVLLSYGSFVIAANNEIAFVNVDVVHPESNQIDRSQTVIVSGKKIKKIGSAKKFDLEPLIKIIDGDGLYLMPGLVEMHAHVPKVSQGQEYLEDMLFLWVANGITTIRNMSGEPAHLQVRAKLNNQEILGPRMFTAGPPFQGKKIKTAEEAKTIVKKQASAGYDFLKVHMGLPLITYDGVVSGSSEVGIAFAGHVSNDIGLWRALEAGQKSIDHLDSYLPAIVAENSDISRVKDSLLGMPYTPFVDPKKIRLVAEATAKAGTWNAPTLTLAKNFITPFDESSVLLGSQYMPPKMIRGWANIAKGFQKTITDPLMAEEFLNYRMQLVKALQDAGAGLLLGSDAPQVMNIPGFSTHNELALMVESGLSPAEALTAGTVNAAIYFDEEETFGRIEENLSADFLIVRGNPLNNISTLKKPVGVMLQGRWLPSEEINKKLEKIALKYLE
ncbi:MAG: amidohydrolase family protein [Pseudomonadota bacterium]|nr:amidohydrolase family protein [Pseudomonadota bacterium]